MDEQVTTNSEVNEEQVTGKLLNQTQREAFEHLAKGEAPFSQRAKALLALDEGATQSEAGQIAGLTSGQVKYWLGKFRNEGLAVFPEVVRSQEEPEQMSDETEAEVIVEPKQKIKQTSKMSKKGKKAQTAKKKSKPKKKKKKSKKAKKAKSSKRKSNKKSKKK